MEPIEFMLAKLKDYKERNARPRSESECCTMESDSAVRSDCTRRPNIHIRRLLNGFILSIDHDQVFVFSDTKSGVESLSEFICAFLNK